MKLSASLPFVLALGLIAHSAHASERQFDLVCTRTSHSESISGSHDSQDVVEYRMDLGAGLFCAGECTRTSRFVDVRPDVIVLFDDDKVDPSLGRTTNHIEISRQTGAYTGWDSIAAITSSTQTKGDCTPAPFKAFPTSKF